MTEYRPVHQFQGDDDPRWRWVNCGLDAWGMAIDKDSLGLVVPDPDRLRDWLIDHEGDGDGTTMRQQAAAVSAVYGRELDVRTLTPDDLWLQLADCRGAVVHIVRKPLGDLFGQPFDGTHGIYAQEPDGSGAERRILLFDTLGKRPVWVSWHRFTDAATQFGAMVGTPGRCLVALTRANRAQPHVAVAAGRWWEYLVEHGQVTRRIRRRTEGFSGVTYKPQAVPWPTLHRTETLLRVRTGAYRGRILGPVRASGVRYVGEEG